MNAHLIQSNPETKHEAASAFQVISKKRQSHFPFPTASGPADSRTVVEYEISHLGRFMLDPNPSQVQRRLIGFEIHYRQPARVRLMEKLGRAAPAIAKRWARRAIIEPERVSVPSNGQIEPMADADLERHLVQIEEELRRYHPVLARLENLDLQRVVTIMGLCEDETGTPLGLQLAGSLETKIGYLREHFLQSVNISLGPAYVSEGLFDMSGFEFQPASVSRILRTIDTSGSKAYVFNEDNKIDFWLTDVRMINYLHLLDLAIQSNPGLAAALNLCATGQARLMRIFFNRRPVIDYKEDEIPSAYRKVLSASELGTDVRNVLVHSLNNHQLGVSIQYALVDANGQRQVHTHLSVIHNIRALDPIRDNLPRLYAAMDQQSIATEAGKFYLLDAIQGTVNE